MIFNRYKYNSLEDYIDTLKDELQELQQKRNKLTFQFNLERFIGHQEEMKRLQKKLDIINIKLRVKTNTICNYHMNKRKLK